MCMDREIHFVYMKSLLRLQMKGEAAVFKLLIVYI